MSFIGQIRSLFARTLIQNLAALYGVQIANYLLPLLTIPFLTRMLGAEGWGWYAFFQSFGLYVTNVVDYSFYLSTTREVSLYRHDLAKRRDLLAGVLGAKLLLAAGALAVCLLLQFLVPAFSQHPLLYWLGVLWAISLAFNFLWYYQGLERMRLAASFDISAKALATLAIFLFIQTPAEGWKVFMFYAGGNLFAAGLAAYLAYREVPFRPPAWTLTWQALKAGWQLFTARIAINLFTIGNNFIMGLLTTPVMVGYFAGAEKISRAAASLANPVTQTLFPRLSLLVHQEPDRAVKLIRRSFFFLLLLTGCWSMLLWTLAPCLTRYILGIQYLPAAPVLRILAFLPLVIGLTNVFGVQWMLALHLDRFFNGIVIVAGLVNITLAVLLVPRWGAVGMAWAVLISETLVAVAIYGVLMVVKLHPLHQPTRLSGSLNQVEQG